MSTQYAATSDLFNVIQQAALGAGTTTGQQNAALLAASSEFDTFGRARYLYPLVSPYDPAMIRDICIVAAWDLINLRGFNPQSGADKNFGDRAAQVRKVWYDVKTQASHYAINETIPPGPDLPSPLVVSQPLQGWNPECGQGGGGRLVA